MKNQPLNLLEQPGLKEQLQHGIYLGQLFQAMNTQEHQAVVHALQDQVGAMKAQYRDHELPFKALHLAFEAVQIAGYAVGGNMDGCRQHIERLDAAVAWLVKDLFTPLPEEPETLPLPSQSPPDFELAYPPQFCDCGCTTEFGDPTGVMCLADPVLEAA